MTRAILFILTIPLWIVFVWAWSGLRISTWRFALRLKRLAPQVVQELRNPALKRSVRKWNYIKFLQTARYVEVGNPELTKLGNRVERLRIFSTLAALVLGLYYYGSALFFFFGP